MTLPCPDTCSVDRRGGLGEARESPPGASQASAFDGPVRRVERRSSGVRKPAELVGRVSSESRRTVASPCRACRGISGERNISGVSMGGQGAFTIGLKHPELFSSIASHMGALSLPPLAGTAEEQAGHASLEPLTLVHSMSARQLRRHSYYFDGGSSDDFGFGQAAIQMGAELAAKGIAYDYQGGPGRHEDAYWVPRLDRSFALHGKQFRAHLIHRPHEPRRPSPAYTWP
ncbi:alpha/beta hydrolase-fold protein [Streptomyces sp. NPDC006173]|uniref:alpha/beta hydrolase-fold protein n=1 Tax=Streptomyces sp. NPDC006173 TaxID=3155349 RepID=UPI0034092C33